MKIALICPSNMLYMPYVKNYEKILIENNYDYEIINWDRFSIEETSENTYRDKKIGHQRNFFDYLKYKKFLMNKLKSTSYDKIIVFGIQLTYFLKKILKNKYKEKYIIDIRDHNKILKFFNLKELIEFSSLAVLSSPGYTEWLPKSNKYVINHNTQISSINELKEVSTFNKMGISIAYIGALRDQKINTDFINSLKNNPDFKLNYHGEGDINNDIISYLKTNEISNVFVTGRYNREDEGELYENSDLINVLLNNKEINNKTNLTNRLYNAILYGKPLISFEGTYVAKEIKKYNLGLVLSSMDDMESTITKYLNEFNLEVYKKGRISYFNSVTEENNYFNKKLKDFIFSS